MEWVIQTRAGDTLWPCRRWRVHDVERLQCGDRFRQTDEIDELGAIAAGVVVGTFFGQFDDAFETAVRLVLGIAEQHAEGGDGGGELDVRGSVGVGLLLIDNGFGDQAADLAVRLLVAEFHGEALMGNVRGGAEVGRRLGRRIDLGFDVISRGQVQEADLR